MPINEEKQASSLIVDLEQLSEAVIQNKFGARHEVIRGVAPEKYITILVVETNEMIAGAGYSLIEDTLKNQFGVSAMQTVFGFLILLSVDYWAGNKN